MKKASDIIFIESAIHIVAQVGIENARTKQIADYAGFSEATLFRAFGTKEEILRSAFLYIDKKLSNIFIENQDTIILDEQFTGLYDVWHIMYRYLISHGEETIFVIRYRYSSLYTDEVRNMRQAYSGGFERAYEDLERRIGPAVDTYREFIVNYMFEMTMCMAERIIAGRISDTPESEHRIWTAIFSAVKSIVGQEM